VIVLVDNEHVDAYETRIGQTIAAARLRIKYRLEDLAADECLVIRYDRVDPDRLRRLGARAVFISGNSADADQYDPDDQEGLRAVVRTAAVPMFGFCGGHQVIAETMGAPLVRIGPDPSTVEEEWAPGWAREFGYGPVTVVADHHLLSGLGDRPVFRHAHAWHVTAIPDGFANLASTEKSELQMLVDDDRRIVGTQFHPEYWTDEHPDGRRLIANFLRWSGLVPEG